MLDGLLVQQPNAAIVELFLRYPTNRQANDAAALTPTTRRLPTPTGWSYSLASPAPSLGPKARRPLRVFSLFFSRLSLRPAHRC